MVATSSDPFLPAEIPERFNIGQYFLDAPAARHPHRTAIAGVPRSVTYAELAPLATRVGNALFALAGSRAHRYPFWLPSSAIFPPAFFRSPHFRTSCVPPPH